MQPKIEPMMAEVEEMRKLNKFRGSVFGPVCLEVYNTILFKEPHHPLQSTTPPSSKYHITLFKVPHHPLQSPTPHSSKYHVTSSKSKDKLTCYVGC